MALRPHDSWLPVIGEQVEVRRHGVIVRRGTVDAVTPDNSILWLTGEGIEPRRMFEREEGYEVWIEHRWES